LSNIFGKKNQHFKAWHYLLQAMKIPKPKSPCLFLEENAYSHTKDFEMTLLLYYISPDRDFGMDCCLKYKGPNDELVLYNIPFYAKQISSLEWKQLKFPVPEGFVSSSIGVNQAGTMNIRTVDYKISENGSYSLQQSGVHTRNFWAAWDKETLQTSGWIDILPPPDFEVRDTFIKGLEDIRLCNSFWTATTQEYSYCDANRIAFGQNYPDLTFQILKPHVETHCEKNWIPLPCGKLIYGWFPLQIGKVSGDRLEIVIENQTPKWFKHLRGSASPVEIGGELWVLTHMVNARSCAH